MIKKVIIFFLLILSINKLKAKDSLYFEVNYLFDSYQLDTMELKSIHNVMKCITPYQIDSIVIYSSSDDVGGQTDYNYILSNNRALTVSDFIDSIYKDKEYKIILKPQGSIDLVDIDNKNQERFQNRKARIIIYYNFNKKVKKKYSKTFSKKPKETGWNVLTFFNKSENGAIMRTYLEYEPGKVEFNIESLRWITATYEALTASNVKIELQGHIYGFGINLTVGIDDSTKLINLSTARVKFLYDYFINRKIDPKRLSYRGFAAINPKYEEENMNNRIDIKIIKN